MRGRIVDYLERKKSRIAISLPNQKTVDKGHQIKKTSPSSIFISFILKMINVTIWKKIKIMSISQIFIETYSLVTSTSTY